ncbi:hypothetical protein NM688_g3506 [Phlebia brevispora]|uniref:Uncharacterized protein n=1 Tax=Phlebia brevispora TaxID=194682 RepID=A0ACC1T5M3_9APHY|nr:hypothetical protein NM688_g3506 [Phlebia brevispora]
MQQSCEAAAVESGLGHDSRKRVNRNEQGPWRCSILVMHPCRHRRYSCAGVTGKGTCGAISLNAVDTRMLSVDSSYRVLGQGKAEVGFLSSAAYHSFMNYDGQNEQVPGIIVPQQVYTVPQQASFQPAAPLRFRHANGHLGINIGQLCNNNLNGMLHASEDAPFGVARISIRIQWPGYETWSRPVNTVQANRPINKGRLASLVALCVAECLNNHQQNRSTERRPDWWANNIDVNQLYLLELRNVSQGSWQPVISLRVG